MGLITKPQHEKNGYRIFTDLQRLKIIRSLRCANYSLSAILRLLTALDEDITIDLHQTLNSPTEGEDIISLCDQLIHSLENVKKNALSMRKMLLHMRKEYSNPPL